MLVWSKVADAEEMAQAFMVGEGDVDDLLAFILDESDDEEEDAEDDEEDEGIDVVDAVLAAVLEEDDAAEADADVQAAVLAMEDGDAGLAWGTVDAELDFLAVGGAAAVFAALAVPVRKGT